MLLPSTPAPSYQPQEIFGLLDMENNYNPIAHCSWVCMKTLQFTSGLESLLTKSIIWRVQHMSIFRTLSMQGRIAWNWENIACSPVRILQGVNSLLDSQCLMQDLEHLIKITIFGFLCRKLKLVHVGIVQIFIFFKKSARRFRKTICTLASQRVACVQGIRRTFACNTLLWAKATSDMDNTILPKRKVHLQWFLKTSIPRDPLIHIIFIDWCASTTRNLSNTANTDQHAIHNHVVQSINQGCYQFSWIAPSIYSCS